MSNKCFLKLVSLSLLTSHLSYGSETSLYGFAGGGLGYAHLLSSRDEEATKTGFRLNLSGFLGYRHSGGIWDFGGGWMLTKLKNDGEKKLVTADGEVKDQRNLNIETRAGFLRVVRRAQIGKAFELGLGIESVLGPSVSFSQDTKSSSPKFFVGPDLAYIVDTEKGRYQFGAQIGTDLNLSQKQLFFPMLTVHYGIPLYRARPEEPEVKPSPAIPSSTIPSSPAPVLVAPAPQAIPEPVEFVISGEFFNFGTASSQVEGNLDFFLKKLTTAIVAQTNNWSLLRVDGHTDARGNFAYNMKLSEQRARVVVDALLKANLSPERVSAKGFGPTQPLDPRNVSEAHTRNRRVELTFLGVKDKNLLIQTINQVKVEALGGAPLELKLKSFKQ